MQILRATSRSINKDRFYQSEQDRKKQIHLQKIRVIISTHLEPLKVDTTVQRQLRKAKSAAKIFEKQEEKLSLRLQNKSLISKIVNVQSTLKPLRNKQILETNKLYETSNAWIQRKKQTIKAQRENEMLTKRCSEIANTNVKDLKKKMQQGIKQYLQLRDSIRKMKPLQTSESKKRQRTISHKKITMGLPLSAYIPEQANNQEQLSLQINDKLKQNNDGQIQIHQKSNTQPKQFSVSKSSESSKRDPFKEVLRLRQLKKLNSRENSSLQKSQQSGKQHIKKAQQINQN